jgi:Flp pilus assembly protein TadG
VRQDERGAAALEFALIFPIFVTLTFGMFQFGWYLWTGESTNSAARETARRIVVGDCWTGYDAYADAHIGRNTTTVVAPSPDGLAVGQEIEVKVTTSADLGIDLVGLLPTTVTRTYTARMEVDTASGDPC